MNVDRRHKPVRRCHVTDAALHDSQAVDFLPMRGNTGSGVRADAACRPEEMEARLRDRKPKSHIHRKGRRGKPLTAQAKGSNRTKSKARPRWNTSLARGPTTWAGRWYARSASHAPKPGSG